MSSPKCTFGGKPAVCKVGKTLSCHTVSWPMGSDEGGKFVDRNLVPLKTAAQQNQFAPTDAVPMRMHFTLAGGC